MNIRLIARKLNVNSGGSNQSLHLNANELARRGHDVTVITVASDVNDVPTDRGYAVDESVSLGSGGQIKTIRAVREALTIAERSADVIHVFNPRFGPVAGFYRRQGGAVPVVVRLNTYTFCSNLAVMDGECHQDCSFGAKIAHSDDGPVETISKTPLHLARTYLEPGLLNSVDKMFALSPTVSEVYRGVGVDSQRITVIPNAADRSFAARKPEESVGYDPDTFHCLYVGRLELQKGVDLLVNAFEMIDANKRVRLHIVGNGPVREELVNLAESCGINDRVTFHGWVSANDVSEHYRAADLFVHPGRWPEPFGRTILESLQWRTPLLVSDVGAPKWIAGDAATVFERENVDDLAKRLETMVNDDRSRAELESNCRVELDRFSTESVIGRLENEYRSVLS